jgi:hypothetical protein
MSEPVDPEAVRREMASRHVYDPCGALSPRTACTRHFHPDDPVHVDASERYWWRNGDSQVKDRAVHPISNAYTPADIANAQERANRNATPGTADEQSGGAPSLPADETKVRARCDCTYCRYCAMPLSKRHEHDHYPIPQALGGTAVVAACVNCHDLKDRLTIEQWPATARSQAMIDLGLTVIPEQADLALLDAMDADRRWKHLSPVARLLYAKMRRRAYGHREHAPGWTGTGLPRRRKGRLRNAHEVCPYGHDVTGDKGYDIPGLPHRRGCNECTEKRRP